MSPTRKWREVGLLQEAFPDPPANALTPCAGTLLPPLCSRCLLETGTGSSSHHALWRKEAGLHPPVWGIKGRRLEEAGPQEQEDRKEGAGEEATRDPGS